MKTSDRSSGIYAIKCEPNGKVYIGSAVSLKHRLATHLSQLRLNKHHSPPLQASWNKYGEACFSFEVLAHVEKEFLLQAEQAEIDERKAANRAYGFNVCPIAGSPQGRKVSQETKEKLRKLMLGNTYRKGTFHSEETLVKLRLARVGRTPAKGMKMTPEMRDRISKRFKGTTLSSDHASKISAALKGKEKSSAHRARLSVVQAMMTPEKVARIREKYSSGCASMRALAVEFECSTQTICNVINGAKQAYALL